MAILMRRGAYNDFEPSKLKAGEWAVVLKEDPSATDGKAAYLCFSAGMVKRIATYEDMQKQFGDMTDDIIAELTNEVNVAAELANQAAQYANNVGIVAFKWANDAKEAASNANAVADDLIDRRDQGEFDGPPGPQGPRGDSGITVPLSGLFTLSGDAEGNLWAYYADGSTPPQFEVDDNNNIYYVIPE